MKPNTAIIIPCYNEAGRLKKTDFLQAAEKYHLIFVNDGSSDTTLNELNSMRHANISVLDLKENVGKANAVRAGVLSLKEKPLLHEITWFGYFDADLATPLEDIADFLLYAEVFHPKTKAIWGSRIYKLGSHIKRHFKRHYIGRFFATVAHLMVGIETYDSQCGAKLFKKELLEVAFGEKFLSRWLFDIEIYLRLKGKDIVEFPLKRWTDVEGSKVEFLPTLLKTIPELYRLRKKYLNP